MTAQGPWNMSRSSINIRQVSIIVCPFSSALIFAISEMWKQQIIWGSGRRCCAVFPLTKMYLPEKSSLPLWILLSGVLLFSSALYHRNGVLPEIRTLTQTHVSRGSALTSPPARTHTPAQARVQQQTRLTHGSRARKARAKALRRAEENTHSS